MEDFERFYNLALRFLSYRPRSEKEVRDRLKVKIKKSHLRQGFGGQAKIKIDELVIDKVIKKLKEKKFINDEEFAKLFVENRLRFKPRGLRLIKIELKQKGIDTDLINKMINPARNASQSDAGGDEGLMINDLESAKKLAEKRIGRLKSLPKQEIYEKLGRFLASKGFNWDTIKHSIDEVLKKGV